MEVTLENFFVGVAAIPGLWGLVCWVRRGFQAQRVMKRFREARPDEWNRLPVLVRLHKPAGVEVLISKGWLQGPEADAFLRQDQYLENSTWIGLLISAALVLLIIAIGYLRSWAG